MIGGGILAYTLVGIDLGRPGGPYFLILDPHYPGTRRGGAKTVEGEMDEAPAEIIAGKWVCWLRAHDKGAGGKVLFNPNSFYNILCPQRPRVW